MNLRGTRVGRMVEALNPFKAVRFARDMWDNGRRASKESGVSLFRIGIEQVALYVLNQLHRREYYMYALHDPALSWEEKRAFIGDRGASRYIDVLTPRRYACLFRNKLVFHRYARSAGLPLAVLYGLFDPKTGATREGRPLRSPDDLRVWIEASDVKDFVIKPVESSQGSMVMPLTADGDAFVSAGGERYSCEDLVHYMTDIESLQEAYPDTPNPPRTFLFEERLRPHPELRDFAEHTLCSTRVMTLSKCDGDIEVLAAAFKLPGEDRGVDNISRGGLCIAVNLDSGALREGVVHKSVPPTRYRKHPVTGKTFYGFELPLWDEVKQVAVRAAEAFPMVRVIGWDIAATDRGVVLLEGNSHWGVMITQQAYREGLFRGSLRATYENLVHDGCAGE